MASPWVQPPMSPSPPTSTRKSGGCLWPWLGWFSHGAMVPFPGDPSVSVFSRACPEKGPLPRRERDRAPPSPQLPTPSMAMTVLRFTLPHLPRLCPPGVHAGALHAAPLLSQPNPPTLTPGGKRAGVPREPLPVTVTPSLPPLCALAAEESGSRGCFGPWLGWFSHGAMWPFRGDPSVSVFCVGLPEKGTRQCRERGVMPPMPATPQTMTTSLRPSPLFPVCALGVEAGAQHAALLPPPDPTCTHTSGGKLVGTPGHSLPGTAVPFLPDLPPLDVNCFAHSACDSVVPPPPTLSPPARQNSETGGLSNTAPHRCSQLCRRAGCPAW